MKNHGIKLLNILLSITLIFFVIALVILLNEPSVQPTSVLYMVCLYAQLIVGAFAIYWSLSKTKKAYHLFCGMLFFSISVLTLLIRWCLPYNLNVWWPVFGILSGVELIITGAYKYRKLKFGYLFPACCLIVVDLWYMLFTFQIIKVPFTKVTKVTVPSFFGVVAMFFILMFILQQRHKNLVIKDDEQGIFSDEEIQLEED